MWKAGVLPMWHIVGVDQNREQTDLSSPLATIDRVDLLEEAPTCTSHTERSDSERGGGDGRDGKGNIIVGPCA